MTAQNFLSKLAAAAADAEATSLGERATLLMKASMTLREHREMIALAGAGPSEDGPTDPAEVWMDMAKRIELFSTEEVSAAFIEAGDLIQAAMVLIEAQLDAFDE